LIQLEKEAARRQADMQTLRRQMEEREQMLKTQYENINSQIRLNLDEEIRRIDQRNQQIVDLSDQIDNKNVQISTLEADKWEMEQKLQKLQYDFEDVSTSYTTLNTEHKFLEDLAKQYELKIPRLEDDLSNTKSLLDNYKLLHGEAVDKVTLLTSNVQTLETNFGELKIKYEASQQDISALNHQLAELLKLKMENELQISSLSNTLIANQQQYEKELSEKLQQQMEEMVKDRESEVAARIAVLAADKDDLLARRLEEINILKQDIENLKQLHSLEIENMNRATDELKNQHQGKIDELNEVIEQKKKQIQKMQETIDEKDKAIFNHLATIQTREATIKSLEVDMADLFQKMVQCDKQIRSEMLEKFTKEKYDLEAEWIAQRNMEMEALRVMMDREQRERNSKQSQDLKNQFQEELDMVHANYRVKIEGIMQEMAEKEGGNLNLRKEIAQLEQRIKELTYVCCAKCSNLKRRKQPSLVIFSSNWRMPRTSGSCCCSKKKTKPMKRIKKP
jgi:chromosome segregation ATPase